MKKIISSYEAKVFIKHKLILLLILTFIFLGEGCAKTNDNDMNIVTESGQEDLDKVSETPINNMDDIQGLWTSTGDSKEIIMQEGGAYLSITLKENGSIKGEYYYIQAATQRISMISFSGYWKESIFSYAFTDDGFGNSGTLKLEYLEKTINVKIEDYVSNPDNASGFGITGALLTKVSDKLSDNKDNNLDDSIDNNKDNNIDDRIDNNTNNNLDDNTDNILDDNTDNNINNNINDDKDNEMLEENKNTYASAVNTYLESKLRTDVAFDEPIFYSDSKVYTEEELKELSDVMRKVFINEIYARHGRIFQDNEWNQLFEQYSWYQPLYNAEEFDAFGYELFNDFEKNNLVNIIEISN